MAYSLKSVTIRADNSESGMSAIGSFWNDIMRGNIPLMYDSDGKFRSGLFPISKYGNYENDENGEYDLTVSAETRECLDEAEARVKSGEFIKIEKSGDSVQTAADAAWREVWSLSKARKIARAFKSDIKYTVPTEYSQDSAAHCVLYISVK